MDTFDILIDQLNYSSLEYNRYVRVYSSKKANNYHFQDYSYLTEYRLSVNHHVQIKCSFFNPEINYYCFSLIIFEKTNNSVKYQTQPDCRPTLAEQLSELQSTTDNLNINQLMQSWSLSAYGPSFKLFDENKKLTEMFGIENFYDNNYQSNSGEVTLPNIINCNCGDNITWNELEDGENSVFLSITSCVPVVNETNCLNWSKVIAAQSYQYKYDRKYFAFCNINFIDKMSVIRMKVIKKLMCDVNSTNRESLMNGKLMDLVVRDGMSRESSLIEIDHHSDDEDEDEHVLSSSTIRIESRLGYYHLIKMDKVPNEIVAYRHLLDCIHLATWYIVVITVTLIISIVIMVLIALTCKRRKEVVQIMLLEDGPNTSVSLINSSLDDFSIEDSGSLEMDYYDYEVHNQIADVKQINDEEIDAKNLDKLSQTSIEANDQV